MTNSAYDLTRYEREERPSVRVSEAPKTKKRARLGFRVYIYALLIIALMSSTVYSSMVLSETQAAISACENELKELQSENAYLSYQVENLVSLKSAEEYAKTELGLVKLSTGRIEYVNLQPENKIVKESSTSSIGEALSEFYKSVIIYLKG